MGNCMVKNSVCAINKFRIYVFVYREARELWASLK